MQNYSHDLEEIYIFHFIVVAGDTVQVVYRGGTDTTPVYESSTYYYNGFTGFRI